MQRHSSETLPRLFEKRCKACGELKPLEDFPEYDNGRKQGRRSKCDDCYRGGRKQERQRRNPPKPLPTHKTCRSCGIEKPVEMFLRKRSKGLTGRCFASTCRKCDTARSNAWRATPAGKRAKKNSRMRKEYGLSLDQYQEMHNAQQGVCAICGKRQESRPGCRLSRDLVIDHCHSSGAVRSLLCSSCNAGLGMFKDDPSLLQSAIAYLARHHPGSVVPFDITK